MNTLHIDADTTEYDHIWIDYVCCMILMIHVLKRALRDVSESKTNEEDRDDARIFLKDQRKSSWDLYASEMAEYVGIGGAAWKRYVAEAIERKRSFKGRAVSNESKFTRKGCGDSWDEPGDFCC